MIIAVVVLVVFTYQWGNEYCTADHTNWIPHYQWGKLEYCTGDHTN